MVFSNFEQLSKLVNKTAHDEKLFSNYIDRDNDSPCSLNIVNEFLNIPFALKMSGNSLSYIDDSGDEHVLETSKGVTYAMSSSSIDTEIPRCFNSLIKNFPRALEILLSWIKEIIAPNILTKINKLPVNK